LLVFIYLRSLEIRSTQFQVDSSVLLSFTYLFVCLCGAFFIPY